MLAVAAIGAPTTASEPATAPAGVACAGPATGKVSCWAAEGNATDSVGSNNGVLQNGVTFAAGVVGSAFKFDGVDDIVSVANNASINFAPGDAMSVSFWMRLTSGASIEHLIGKRDVCSTEEFNWQVAFDTSGFQYGGRPPNGTLVAKPAMNTWVHVTGTQTGNKWRLYLNGDLAATKVGSLGPLNSVAMLLGRSGLACAPFGGLLDEVQIWSRALTDDQVAQTYRANAACMAKPGAPAILSPAVNQTVSTKRPKLDWTARGCATSYKVQIRRGSKTGPVVVNRSGLTKSSFTTPALAGGKTWAWRATACNAHGCRAGAWKTFKTPH
jgi:hypothetical protein